MAVSSPGRAPEGSRRREPPPRERTRSSLPESPRAAGPRRSARAARCPAPPCRAPGFGRPIQRRARPGLRPSRASFQSARSPNRTRRGFGRHAAPQRAPARRAMRSSRPAAASSRSSKASSRPSSACGSSPARSAIASSSQSSRPIPARRAASRAASRVRRLTPAIVHATALFMSSTISPEPRIDLKRRGGAAPQLCRASW